MSIKLSVPEKNMIQLKPRISVIGIGGGGGNAVNNMINKNLEGVDFIVANTDAQALSISKASCKIQLGLESTKGLGAGANPEIGRMAAEEALEEIEKQLENVNMVFITAGMGGGTGSGAAPVIAKLAKSKNILTIGVVTKPFQFEGRKRSEIARVAIEEFAKTVDSIIIIPNQNLFRIADKSTTLADAFILADNVLYAGIRSITDLMIMPGLINLDFADVKAIMEDQGKAIMGTGEAEGENRAVIAAEEALSNPLLDDCSVLGAKGVLINITGGSDITLFEIDEAANRIREEIDEDANIIFGSSYEESLSGKIRVSIVATGIAPEHNSYLINKPIKVKAPSSKIENINISDEHLEKFSASKDSEKSNLESLKEDLEFINEPFSPVQIPAEDKEIDHDSLENSEIIEGMPKASSLFKAIVNKQEPINIESQLEIALAESENSFSPKANIKIIEEDQDLFKNNNNNQNFKKQHEEEERLIVNDDDYTPTLIERVTGFSIAKRNKKKMEEEQKESFSPSLSSEENEFQDNKLNLEIPSFLRRK